jgi:hypothetical protein
MSLRAEDLIHLPYDRGLTQAGIAYATRWLLLTGGQAARVTVQRLRRMGAGVAAEMAFRRWLEAEDVAYGLVPAAPITMPERRAITLGGRRIDLHTQVITSRRHIDRLHRTPGWLLQAEALVPDDFLLSDRLGEGDLYIFIFLTGLETRTRLALRRALASGRPSYPIAIPPGHAWAHPRSWHSLGLLALEADAPHPWEVEVGGQTGDRQPLRQRVRVRRGGRGELSRELYTLQFLHSQEPPAGTLRVFSPALRRTWSVLPSQWENAWFYGLEIVLTGWLTKGAFRRKAHRMPGGTRTRLDRRLRGDHRAVPITGLKPMQKLVERLS